MNRVTWALGVAAVAAAAWAARPTAGAGAGEDGLTTAEGELRPAAALFGPPPAAGKAADPLADGGPGGLWADDKFVLLLVDGRVLAKLRAALPGPATLVRARGIAHDKGRAIDPVRIEYKVDGEWVAFDLPRSGTLAPTVLGGDE
jgi:hypothetical protein